MNRYINCLLGSLMIMMLFACDKVDAPYREEGSKGIVYINQTDSLTYNGDTLSFAADNSAGIKKVLAEDYTGHLCGNCPYAGVLLNDTIKPLFGEQLVVISVHAGFFATPCPGSGPCPGSSAPAGAFANDLTSPASVDWDNFFGISSGPGNPDGMIDRKDYPASNVKSPDTWTSQIQSESVLSPECKIRILTRYNTVSREFGAAVQTRFLGNKTGTYKLEVVVTEDSIVDWQEWYLPHLPQFDPTYVHRYVLRGAVNGSFAAAIADGSVTAGTTKLNGFSYTLKPEWNARHCKVVAFLYDASNYRVLQVEEANITQ